MQPHNFREYRKSTVRSLFQVSAFVSSYSESDCPVVNSKQLVANQIGGETQSRRDDDFQETQLGPSKLASRERLITDSKGEFEINSLPEGSHVFRVWHERTGT